MNAKGCYVVQNAVQALLRMAFFVLVYQSVLASRGTDALICFAGAAVVLVFGLMPGRFVLGQTLRRMKNEGQSQSLSYAAVLRMGLVRLGRGMAYALPVTALLVWFVTSYFQTNGQEFGRVIKRFSWFLFKSPENVTIDLGLMGFLVPVVLLALYFLIGWHQDAAMEYAAYPGSCRQMLKKVRQVREMGEKMLWGAAFGNAALCLASFICLAAVVVGWLLPVFSAADGMFALLQTVLGIMDQHLPGGCLWVLAGIYVLVCTPLCMIRKMRTAKAVHETEMEL